MPQRAPVCAEACACLEVPLATQGLTQVLWRYHSPLPAAAGSPWEGKTSSSLPVSYSSVPVQGPVI